MPEVKYDNRWITRAGAALDLVKVLGIEGAQVLEPGSGEFDQLPQDRRAALTNLGSKRVTFLMALPPPPASADPVDGLLDALHQITAIGYHASPGAAAAAAKRAIEAYETGAPEPMTEYETAGDPGAALCRGCGHPRHEGGQCGETVGLPRSQCGCVR